MKTYKNLYEKLASFPNLYKAYKKVKRRKKNNLKIAQFELDLERNLLSLQKELLKFTYRPRPMKKRRYCEGSKKKDIFVPHLKDRIVQQALKQVLYPIFDKSVIYDSYAFRIGRGSHSAIKRFDLFKRRIIRKDNLSKGHILKMDIKEYYPNINHHILINIIKEKIMDKRIIWLIKIFLQNSPNKTRFYSTYKGIPIGSPLSQLLANIYLNKLDYYIKHDLRKKYYLRFSDDCTILSKDDLKNTEQDIKSFLRHDLTLTLHPQKTLHSNPYKGINLLGYKICYFYKRIKNKNIKRLEEKMKSLQSEYTQGLIKPNKLTQKIRGWTEYARYADSYRLRKKLFSRLLFSKNLE